MADNKYGKYILKEPWGIRTQANQDADQPVYIGINQETPAEGWDEAFTQVLRPIYRPYLMIPKPHNHNCAEFLYFIGGNPMDFGDFGAEIEFVMGEGDDAETYTITSTTWVYVPKDLPHGPLNFKTGRPADHVRAHHVRPRIRVDHQLQPRPELTLANIVSIPNMTSLFVGDVITQSDCDLFP